MARFAVDESSKAAAASLGFAGTAEGVKNAIEDLVERRNRLAHDLPEDASLLAPDDLVAQFRLVSAVASVVGAQLRGILANILLSHSSSLQPLRILGRLRNGTVIMCDTPCSIRMSNVIVSSRLDGSSQQGWDIHPIARMEYCSREIRRVDPKHHPQVGIELRRGRIFPTASAYLHPGL